MRGGESYSDEEEQGLVQRPPALLGLKFKDEEDFQLVRRVSMASIGLVVLSVLLFFFNLHHKGHAFEGLGHLVLSMLLPCIGYLAVKEESARLMWLFHLGNVQFAIFHAVVACIMLHLVLELEMTSPQFICRPYEPANLIGGAVVPAQLEGEAAAAKDLYAECIAEVNEKKGHIPWKLFWWATITAPLWACMIYAAYQAHEYYFRLRVRTLMARTGEGGGGTATIVERDPLNSDAVE